MMDVLSKHQNLFLFRSIMLRNDIKNVHVWNPTKQHQHGHKSKNKTILNQLYGRDS